VLGDPNRRSAYDRGGSFDPADLFASFGGIEDVLSRFFGGSPFGGGARGPAQGDDIAVGVTISLEEAASGVDRDVDFTARLACPTCSGSGSQPGSDLETCEQCSGQGAMRVTRQTMLGTTMSIVTCDRCAGRGRTIVDPCEECAGSGAVVAESSVEVNVPPGVEHGTRIRLAGRGQAGDPGARSGDLYVQIAVTPDDRFERHGADLLHRARIGVSEAVLGVEIDVPTVGGDPIPIEVPAGTQPGTVFKLAKRGMPRLQRRGKGDLLVEVVVEIPSDLGSDAEEALRAYGEAMDESPNGPRRSRRRK
jgi:molecular chaperone DnaJ